MFLEHIGLRILLQMIYAPGPYASEAAGPEAAAPGDNFLPKSHRKAPQRNASKTDLKSNNWKPLKGARFYFSKFRFIFNLKDHHTKM